MADAFACNCAACRTRAIRWPLMLIATGILFSLDMVLNVVEFWKTWPILLIVAGIGGVAARLAPDTGHADAFRPAPSPAFSPPFSPPFSPTSAAPPGSEPSAGSAIRLREGVGTHDAP